MIKACTYLVMAMMALQAEAHSRFTAGGNIPGRDNNAGHKTGPCGGVARTATPKALTAGTQVRVDWEETIQHPGRYEFYFSPAGDANFVKIGQVIDTQDSAANLPHAYNTMLTVPSGACTDCTLQMIQVMTENNPPTLYYSCADVTVSSAPTPSPTPLPTPSPAPGPSPDPGTCH